MGESHKERHTPQPMHMEGLRLPPRLDREAASNMDKKLEMKKAVGVESERP